MQDLDFRYLMQCRQSYFDGITPFNTTAADAGYVKLVGLASFYEQAGRLEELAHFMLEGQYYIDLWTAQLLIKYFKPTERVKAICQMTIEKYH